MEDNSSFDGTPLPKEQVMDLLVNLFKKKAFDEQSSVFLSQYSIKEQILEELIRKDIIHLFSQNSPKIYLTNVGRFMTCEEFVMRLRENKKFTDEKFENQIAEIIDNVEKIAKEYELTIKRGNLGIKCPYSAIIKIYEYIKQIVLDRGWNELAEIYYKQIQFYQDKVEKNKKLREFKIQKLQKQKEIEEFYKIKEIDAIRAVILSLEKEKDILDYEEGKKEKLRESEEIFKKINDAERMAKEYEKEIQKGKILQLNCPYEKIIEIYRKVKKGFENIGWKEESNKLIDSIKYYQEKVEQDKKLREIEERKVAKE